MKLTVRVAARGDIPAVARLLAEMDNEPPMPLARAERLFREMARYPDYRCYLAYEGDEPVATFTLLIFDALVHGGSREALLDGVVVTAARRGQGIGRAMIQEAMRLAANAGCYKLALSSNIKRKDAHRFYESLGFQQHGISFAILAPGSSGHTHSAADMARSGVVTE
jgi:GNAT superfamily N-acetyltransferase